MVVVTREGCVASRTGFEVGYGAKKQVQSA